MPFSAWVGCHYAKIVGKKLPEYDSCDEDTSQGDLLSHRIFRPSIKWNIFSHLNATQFRTNIADPFLRQDAQRLMGEFSGLLLIAKNEKK